MSQELRFATRMLIKRPGFAMITGLTLALGIGSCSAVFNLVKGVLLAPPQYPKPEQIILIEPARLDGGAYSGGCTTAQWDEWRKATNSFETIAGYEWGFQFLILNSGSESVDGMFVTPEYFNVIRKTPLLGRPFVPSDMALRKGQQTPIILGYNLWQRRFSGDSQIIGKTIRLSRRPALTVIGVMPPGLRFLPSRIRASEPNYDVNAQVDFWIPLWLPDLSKPKDSYCNVVARLRDGATVTQAQAELTAIAAKQAQADQYFKGITARAEPLAKELNRVGQTLLMPLSLAVALVFLIACVNATGLQLVRGLQRQQEYAVRFALGAGRTNILRLAVIEGLLLAGVGAVAGLGLAVAILKVLKVLGGIAIPRLESLRMGWPLLTCCCGLAMLAGMLASFAPAIRASRLNPMQAVKGDRPTGTKGHVERRLLGAAVIIQTALTLALLVCAGLLLRTMKNLADVTPGYQTQNILTMLVTMPEESKFADFHSRALTAISALPGVRNAAFAWGVPLTGNDWVNHVEIEGLSDAAGVKDQLAIPTRSVTDDYFAALGLRIITGRSFQPTDAWYGPNANTNAPFVVVINQAMAQKYFGEKNPVGRKLRFPDTVNAPGEIIGVLSDARNFSLTRNPEPEVYLYFWQAGAYSKHLVVRTASDPTSVVGAIRRELRSIDPTVAIEKVRTLKQIRGDSVAAQSFVMRLMLGFSILACTLAVVGVYGVLWLSVNFRQREMAIRTALGAQRHNVVGLVLREGLKLLAVGVICGIATSIALTRVFQTFLFGITPTDPGTFLGAAIFFAIIGMMACWLPAFRATRIDPMTALRCE